jgi:Cd2+/Zn2+-exporting ATPase/Cu+-exporting ATPase
MGAIENYPMPQPALAERESAAHGAHESVRTDAVVFALVGMAAAVSWLGVVPRVGGVDVVAVAAVVGGGWGVFREAVENLFVRRMTMELSMTMALVAALAIREFTTAAFILFFVLGAEILEQMTVSRGRQALVDLAALLPRTAVVRRGSELAEAPITEVQAGDVVVIRPGAEIPVDGVVVAGESAVNQSSITGESIPVDKRPGAAVFAGTTNYLGTLDVRTERVGLDTAFGQIVAAVETAERSRAPIQKLADRLAGWIVYFALASALVTMVLTHNLRSTIAVIIAAGACGVAAGTPLAVLGAIGRSARNGAVVKGGRFMEALGKIDLVVLDKTGTLTFGEPYVTAVIPYPGEDGDRVIRLAAIAERPSEHPLARAIQKEAARWGVIVTDPESFEYLPGRGVRCNWNGKQILVGNAAWVSEDPGLATQLRRMPEAVNDVLVACSGRLVGALRFEDVLRPEAVEAVARIKSMGIGVTLLTGDSARVAEKVARELGVEDFAADLLPKDKFERVALLTRSGTRVAMVGDGINDAPALTQATVGIAMGSGTDLARQTAGVLLLGNNLLDCVDLLETARRCRRIILFNFGGTLGVDLAGIALAAAGILTPLLAAVLHVTSEMAFILNSARLAPRAGGPRR